MKSKQGWVLAVTSVGSFLIVLDALVVTTALSAIRLHLHASIETLEWTVNAYTLSFAVLLMTGAALGDRFGRRRLFAGGLGLFTVASAACALSPSIGVLIAARVVQGAGAALVMPVSLTLLSTAFPARQRGRALGIFSSLTGLGTLSGPFVGGAIAQSLGWQWIFWINVPVGLIAIALVLSRIEESHGPETRLDVRGLGLVTLGALGLVWGLVRGNSAGWGSVEVVGALAAGAVLMAVFVVWERRARVPMVPMRIFRIRAFAAANVANFCLYASMYGTMFFLAQYLQTALGYGPLGAGLRLLPLTATLTVCAPIAGALADRIGERWLLVGGLVVQAVGMGWLALIARPDLDYGRMLLPLLISGCGTSLAIPAVQRAAVGAVAAAEIGKASGVVNTLRFMGGAFGIAILVAVFAGLGSFASPRAFTDGFAPAIGVAAALALVGAAAGLGIPRRREATEAPMHPPAMSEAEIPSSPDLSSPTIERRSS